MELLKNKKSNKIKFYEEKKKTSFKQKMIKGNYFCRV